MKNLTGILVVTATILALLLTPFSRTDVSELLPVQTLCLCVRDGACRLETDAGLMGQGDDPQQALEDLKRTAPGVVVLSTAKQLVVEDAAAQYLKPLLRMDVLRPGTELYRAAQKIDVRDASAFLSRHGVQTTVSHAQAADLYGERFALPCLMGGEGRYYIVGSQGT